jgi:hypothetical protein
MVASSPCPRAPPFLHDRETTLPDGTVLVTSFHPSRQNTNTGKLTREMWYAVFERIGRKDGRTERRKVGTRESENERK